MSNRLIAFVQPGRGLGTQLMTDRAVAETLLQAVEPGYPPDQIEVCCDVLLREELGLRDGDPIAVRLDDTT